VVAVGGVTAEADPASASDSAASNAKTSAKTEPKRPRER
jgi:hypothetical protein